MEKLLLKKLVRDAIEARGAELIAIAKEIWEHPEPGYEEFRTSKLVEKTLRSLGLPCRTGLARTGIRADLDTGRPGPAIAILGELDALIMPENPHADPVTHAAHACGHNLQIAAMLGAAAGLAAVPEVRELLSGRIAFIACPAEECRITHFDEITFLGGKAELIREGVFDDISISFMTHASAEYGAARSSNGFVMKEVSFFGKAGHAGRPWCGVNALSAARLALDAVDMQRDLFKDDDSVRVHGIFQHGGSVVNIVPEKVDLEYQIRAKTPAAVKAASELFDRSMRGAATAFGVRVAIRTYAGYMPLHTDPELLKIHRSNLEEVRPGTPFGDFGHRTSSTDMGDVSAIMPGIHPYTGNWSGVGHHESFHWNDEHEAFVDSGKILAGNAIDLLFGDAAEAKRVVAASKPQFTRREYLDFLNSLNGSEEFDGAARQR